MPHNRILLKMGRAWTHEPFDIMVLPGGGAGFKVGAGSSMVKCDRGLPDGCRAAIGSVSTIYSRYEVT